MENQNSNNQSSQKDEKEKANPTHTSFKQVDGPDERVVDGKNDTLLDQEHTVDENVDESKE